MHCTVLYTHTDFAYHNKVSCSTGFGIDVDASEAPLRPSVDSQEVGRQERHAWFLCRLFIPRLLGTPGSYNSSGSFECPSHCFGITVLTENIQRLIPDVVIANVAQDIEILAMSRQFVF
jgi:hypothetical protein